MYSKVYQIRATASDASGQALLAIIATELERHRPRKIEQKEERIEFRAGILRLVTNWNLLVPITSGTIEFRKNESCLVYSLSFMELIVFGVMATLFMIIIPLATGAPKEILVIVPILVWGWLVGMNFLLGISRFGSFIKKCIAKASFEIVK
jgi:hypothetical protein